MDDVTHGRTELHFHLLPDIDDGPADDAAAVELARAALRDGTTTIVCTPHARFVSGARDLIDRVAALRRALQRAGVRMDVRPGAELQATDVGRFSPTALDAFSQGPPGGRWLLLEAPLEPGGLDELYAAAAELLERGFGVLLAHPERSPQLLADAGGLDGLRDQGVLLQVNATSLTGLHGDAARAGRPRPRAPRRGRRRGLRRARARPAAQPRRGGRRAARARRRGPGGLDGHGAARAAARRHRRRPTPGASRLTLPAGRVQPRELVVGQLQRRPRRRSPRGARPSPCPGSAASPGLRASSQASATCPGVASWRRGDLGDRRRPARPARRAASGNQGMKPMPSLLAVARARPRTGGWSGCRGSARWRPSKTSCAASISSTETSESPRWRMMPSSCSSFSAPNCSSRGTLGSMRCSCHRSMRSTPSRRRLISTPGAGTRGGRPACHSPGPVRVSPPLVAIDDAVVRVQRLVDQVLGDVGAVGVGGVDEVDAQLGQRGEHGERLVVVRGRAPDAVAGDAHGAVAEAGDLEVAADLERAGRCRGDGGHDADATRGRGARPASERRIGVLAVATAPRAAAHQPPGERLAPRRRHGRRRRRANPSARAARRAPPPGPRARIPPSARTGRGRLRVVNTRSSRLEVVERLVQRRVARLLRPAGAADDRDVRRPHGPRKPTRRRAAAVSSSTPLSWRVVSSWCVIWANSRWAATLDVSIVAAKRVTPCCTAVRASQRPSWCPRRGPAGRRRRRPPARPQRVLLVADPAPDADDEVGAPARTATSA